MMADGEYIRKLCRTLRPGNPLRRQAEMVIANPQARIEDMQPFLRVLTDMPWRGTRDRTIISWLICTANWYDGQRALISDTLSTLVNDATKDRKPGRFMLRWLCRSAMWCLPVVMSLVILGGWEIRNPERPWSDWASYVWSISLAACAAIVAMGSIASLPLSIWIDNRSSAQISQLVDLLGDVGRPEAIGSIANAYLHWPLRESAGRALAKVAAGLRPDHYGALPTDTVPALCRALAACADAAAALVILQALSVIGDGRAIDAVEHKRAKTGSREVSQSAASLLGVLHRRAEQSRTASMLLRASGPAPETPQTLLRAVSSASSAHDAELLRGIRD